MISNWFLRPETQPELGEAAYDQGAQILQAFFDEQLKLFLEPDLDPLGRQIIDCCLSRGGLESLQALIPHPTVSAES